MRVKLTEEEKKARHVAHVRKWEAKNPEKRKEYTKKYYQSEAGKAKKAEQNRKYREKMKLEKLFKSKISKAVGEGQSECRTCKENGKWSLTWHSFLYKVENKDGVYCYECAKELVKEMMKNEEI